MNVKIHATVNFRKEAKPLLKKYASLKQELAQLADLLEKTPKTGTFLGNDNYKIRLAVKSKGKGKSGGLRVVTHIEIEVDVSFEQVSQELTHVFLLSIYDKSEYDTISQERLEMLIDEAKQEIDEQTSE